jgi:hypothetical protein
MKLIHNFQPITKSQFQAKSNNGNTYGNTCGYGRGLPAVATAGIHPGDMPQL